MQLTQLTPSISAQNPSIFKFGQNEIRVFERNNEPWFVATDIAKCLGLSNPTKATASLRDSERSNLKLERGGYLVIVSESGLYTMILRSDSAIKEGTPAFNFRVWVTDDLLPTLRKTGQYSTVRENRTVASLTPAQQLAIQQAVGRRAQKTANHYQTIYRAIKLRYQIARYDQLPQGKFEDCLKFIETVDLHVPEAPAPEQPKPVTAQCPMLTTLSRADCEKLLSFVYEFKYLHRKQLEATYEMLRAVQSPLAPRFYEFMTSWSLGNLESVLAKAGYSVKNLDAYKHLMGIQA